MYDSGKSDKPSIIIIIYYDSGIYPSDWTVTTITPIFKGKGSKNSESNYRGISVSVLSFEQCFIYLF